MRSHAMGSQEIGLWLGLTQGGAGIVGIVIGGVVAGRWFVGNEQAQLRMSAAMVALLVPLLGGFLFADGKYQALGFLVPYMMVLFFFFAPVYTLFQRLMPDSVRATTLAILMMFTHLISMGLGPQIVGIISDQLNPTVGSDSLRYAMMIVSVAALIAGFCFWKAGNGVQAALRFQERDETGVHSSARIGH